jgi:hypothetical protein
MKITVFWDAAPCGLVEVYRRLRDDYCLHHQDDVRGCNSEHRNLQMLHLAVQARTR